MKKNLLVLLLVVLSLPALAQSRKVRIQTEYGPIVIMLYDGTPLHRDNMLALAKGGFYDSLLWHRVIPSFVVQGGDPTSKGAAPGVQLGGGERTGVPRIPAEIKPEYYHKRGAVGMARDQNPEKASSNCQFYIVVGKKFTDAEIDAAQGRSGGTIPPDHREVYRTTGGTPHLDGGYTVFGEVVEGMDVVDKIAAEARNPQDRPARDIHMLRVRPVRKKFLGIF